MNNINLEEYKTDYNNCMRAEDMIIKYNINEYYFKNFKKILNLNRGTIGKLDYVLKNNNIIYETQIIDEPVKPIKPCSPWKPESPLLPVNPVLPSYPWLPAKPILPANPRLPVYPSLPANPAKPRLPVNPNWP